MNVADYLAIWKFPQKNFEASLGSTFVLHLKAPVLYVGTVLAES